MSTAFISPRYLKIANEVMAWTKTYLMADHPDTKRPGDNQQICPFVRASMESDSLYLAFHPEINGQRDWPIEKVMYDYIEIFNETPPFSPAEKRKKALLVIFPEIPLERAYVLDIVHAKIKSKFVDSGLMAGQFHPNCDDRGVYNRAFRISISPYPLIAIRHMALHDIIFLKDNEEWFKAYNIRYGERFKEPEKLEDYSKSLLGTYLEAKERYLK